MRRMLIIEDEEAIRMALEDDFRLEGFNVTVASDGKAGLALALKQHFDVILLDVMLPEMDGIQVCNELRRNGKDTPVIMLTAKSQEIDRVLGLEIGADDYVTKPFSPRELQARVKALLRRASEPPRKGTGEAERIGEILIDRSGHQVIKNGEEIRLTAREFALLEYFLDNRGKVVSRNNVLNAVWNDDVIVELRTVDTHIANLRKKLETDPSNPRWIIGIRGVGYKLINSEE